jgi:3-vinyl bacteriochlorophyllide hydratase
MRSPKSNEFRLYSAAERARRDASKWTLVQGILAPIQFAVFLISLGLVLRYLADGQGLAAATASILVKTALLYTIMLTGSLWEHDVFGKYLFARAFFWEDVVSMLVLALHGAYVVSLLTGWLTGRQQMQLALAAYATYLINASQFLIKLRAARREKPATPAAPAAPAAPGLALEAQR